MSEETVNNQFIMIQTHAKADDGGPVYNGKGAVNDFPMIFCGYRDRDFLNQPMVVIQRVGMHDEMGSLQLNKYKNDHNKAPELVGRGYFGDKMYRLIAWQSTDHRGQPKLTVKLENWDTHLQKQDDYRKSKGHDKPPPAFSCTNNNTDEDDIPF